MLCHTSSAVCNNLKLMRRYLRIYYLFGSTCCSQISELHWRFIMFSQSVFSYRDFETGEKPKNHISVFFAIYVCIESYNHRMLRSCNSFIPTSPGKGRNNSHLTRLFKALSNLTLNTAKDGASRISLDSLFQCLTTHTAKNSSLESKFPSFNLYSLLLVLSFGCLYIFIVHPIYQAIIVH